MKNRLTLVKTLLLLALAAGCGSEAAPGSGDAAVPDLGVADGAAEASGLAGPSGVYLAAFSGPLGDPAHQKALAQPGLDGVFIFWAWSKVEPQEGTFDWAALDADIDLAVAAGKKFSLAIPAGGFRPDWVCSKAQCLKFVFSPLYRRYLCDILDLPVPWDAQFLNAWTGFMQALHDHLAASPARYAALSMVKMTGINHDTDEIALPSNPSQTLTGCTSGPGCMTGVCTTTDSPSAWRTVGYSSDKVKSAWAAIAQAYAAAFPDKLLDFQTGSGFPIVNPSDDKILTETLARQTLAMFPGGFVLQGNGLRAGGGIPSWLAALGKSPPPNLIVGYQMAYFVYGDPNCQMGARLVCDGGACPCTEVVLRDSVDEGLANGARFLEIYTPDVDNYPNTIGYAHQQLVH